MPPSEKSTKNKTSKKAAKPAKSFEETLWDTANKLRGSVESSDWSGATETTHQSCSDGERGGAIKTPPHFYIHYSSFTLPLAPYPPTPRAKAKFAKSWSRT
ncbi:MAG: hypothetical protein ABF334_03325, partial [Akkermansiaceae bacterium]